MNGGETIMFVLHHPSHRTAYLAVEELLRRATLHCQTGKAYLEVDLNQSGVTRAWIDTGPNTKEIFKPNL